ncbi:SdpI family protein [candidate division WWE3 bacterium]|nr:SdpI family protein [candidate division WWE3 bacterium]
MSRSTLFAIIILVAISLVLSLLAYSMLPNSIVVHWGIDGSANGYGSKLFGISFVPLLMIGLGTLFAIIPKADPLKENWKLFKQSYDTFIIGFMVFLLYVHGITLAANIFPQMVAVGPLIMIGIGSLFVLIGFILPKIKQNWFFGLRTPWTISNEVVWDKTHALGGKLFILFGVLTMSVSLWPRIGFYVFMGFLPVCVVSIIVYSYFSYKHLEGTRLSK